VKSESGARHPTRHTLKLAYDTPLVPWSRPMTRIQSDRFGEEITHG